MLLFAVYKYAPVLYHAMYDGREKAPVARANAYDLVHGVEMAFQKVRDHLMFRTSQPILSFEELTQVYVWISTFFRSFEENCTYTTDCEVI